MYGTQFLGVVNDGPFKGKSPYEAKFGEKVDVLNKRIRKASFGQKIFFLPRSKKHKKLCKKFGSKMCERLMMGYTVHSGMAWSDGYLVIEANEFKNKPSNHTCTIFPVRDIEVIGNTTFPISDGAWKPQSRAETTHMMEDDEVDAEYGPDEELDEEADEDVLPSPAESIAGDFVPETSG